MDKVTGDDGMRGLHGLFSLTELFEPLAKASGNVYPTKEIRYGKQDIP
jgi:hypothetical protein